MLGQLFLAFYVNMFAKQGMDRSTRTPTLSQVRAVCTQREPTGRVIIVIVTEREKKKKEKRHQKKREGDTREERREKRRERRSRVYVENVLVSTFKAY